MTMMRCKECGKDVSTKAEICQKCGAPAPSDEDYEEKRQAEIAYAEAEEAKHAPKRRIRKYALHWLWISPILFVVAAIANPSGFLGASLMVSWFGAILVVCIPKAIWVAIPVTVIFVIFGIAIIGKDVNRLDSKPSSDFYSRSTDSSRYSACVDRCYDEQWERIQRSTGTYEERTRWKQTAREVCEEECLGK